MLASRAGRVGDAALAIGAGALGVLVVGWLVLREARPGLAELRLPSPRVIEQQARMRTVADYLATSLGMPTWFGAQGQLPARIAGQVIGGRGAMTVRLALDIPAPSLWVGREVQADASGHFDFGPMRAGPYLLIAYDGELTSRLTSLDTARDPEERADLFVYPCQHVRHVVELGNRTRRGAALPGVPIELAGRVVGATDATGAYDVCIAPDDEARLDVRGYTSLPPDTEVSVTRHEVRAPSLLASGTVMRAPGVPAGHVGVQPMWWHDPIIAHYASRCVGVSAVMTSDDDGRFAYDDSDRLCGFRILDRTRTLEWVFWPYRSRVGDPLVVTLGDVGAHAAAADIVVRRPLPWTRGRARVHGVPVADARVGIQDCWERWVSCALTTARTRLDGGFWMQVPPRHPGKPRRWVIFDAQAEAIGDERTAHVSARSSDGIVVEDGPAPVGHADVADVAAEPDDD